MSDMDRVLYLMAADWGDLAYAIAAIIMIVATSAGNYYKKKKDQARFEESIQRRSQRRVPRPGPKLEDLVEVLLPRQARAPQRPKPPRVASPLEPPPRPPTARPRPARPAAPPPPERRGLGALHADDVVIDSAEHAKAVEQEAARLGLAAEKHARKLRSRYRGETGTPAESKATPFPSAPSRSRELRFSKAELRRAIIMNEILGKPVALRDPTDS